MSCHLTRFKSFFLIILGLFLVNAGQAQKESKKPANSPEPAKYYLDTVGVGLSFRSVGPSVVSGRIADFAIHPSNSKIYYVAVASGGIWKTVNSGTTFEPVFDSQGSYSTACVALDPNNPNVVWVGTGENNNQRSVSYGDGVYKSADGGKTWKNVGLKQSEHIGRILIDPRNSDVVYVSAIGPLWSAGGERGVYKTTDGGKTWNAVLSIDEHTGVNDLIMDPRNPDVLYAAAHQRRRHVFTYVGGGPGSAIYKTTDGGKTWEKANQGLPAVDLGRIGLAISPADPEVIYAIVEAAEGQGGFYCSTNRGASWEKRSGYRTSGNYYQEVVAHPTNPNIVYVMDTYLQWSTDGGRSFRGLGEQNKHVDNHAMWIDPKDTDHYLVGCDGGIYESFDGAQTWDFKANLPITQFYKVAVDNTEPFFYIYGGTQDNFSLGGPSRTRSGNGIPNSDWFVTQGGDGFESQVDPNNPNIVYAQAQYGALVRYDRSSGEATGIQPKPEGNEEQYRWNWDAPLTVSGHKPERLYFSANKIFRSDDRGDSWTVISPDLTRQLDRNQLPVMGRIQSIDAVEKNGSTSPYGNIVAFSESPLDENLLLAGTDDGLIQITEDGGRNWTKIDVNNIAGAPERTYVNYLLGSQHDKNVVYAAFNHHKYGDFRPYLYKSTDRGRTWKAISATLPERGSVYSIAEDHVDPNLLFTGTEFGCFFSVDGGQHWKALKGGLPTIAVRDMAIQKREDALVLATFGRGFYVLDDYSPLRQLKQENLAAEAAIFPIKNGLAFIEDLPLGLRGKSFQGHSYYAASNPPVGVTFTYYVRNGQKTLREKRREMEKEKIKKGEAVRYPTYEEYAAEERQEAPYLLFTIRDTDGNIVRKLKSGVSKGVNRIVWDGRMPSVNPVALGAPAFENIFGNPDQGILAMPGDYTVELAMSVDGKLNPLAQPQRFTLQTLGGVTLAASDRSALLAFQKEAQQLQRAVNGAGEMLSDAGQRVRYMREAIYSAASPTPELTGDLQRIEEKMYNLRKQFYGDNIAGRVDKGTGMSIAERVGAMTDDMWRSTSAPTKTQRDALRVANEAFRPVLDEIRKVLNEDIKALEKKLEAAGAPYTPGRTIDYGKQ